MSLNTNKLVNILAKYLQTMHFLWICDTEWTSDWTPEWTCQTKRNSIEKRYDHKISNKQIVSKLFFVFPFLDKRFCNFFVVTYKKQYIFSRCHVTCIYVSAYLHSTQKSTSYDETSSLVVSPTRPIHPKTQKSLVRNKWMSNFGLNV